MATRKTTIPLTITVSKGNQRLTVSVTNKPISNRTKCEHYPDCHFPSIVHSTKDLGIICDLCRVILILLKEQEPSYGGFDTSPWETDHAEDEGYYGDQPFWTPLKNQRK